MGFRPEAVGGLNGPTVGILMKEMVRRAIVVIRNERLAFDVTQKMGRSGQMDDVLTSADRAAQKTYVHTIKECFPGVGIVAEEENLRVEPQGTTAYFTIDPLDGTKAFVRRQSHGIGTMLSLVLDGEVVAACVGDVSTQEVYYYRPGSWKVHRLTEFNTSELMHIEEKDVRPLVWQYLLLRDPPHIYTEPCQPLIRTGFKNLLVDGGSIGTWMARLWKREVGAVLINAGAATPWDWSPVVGISLKLDYLFFKPTSDGKWENFVPLVQPDLVYLGHDTLVVHRLEHGYIDDIIRV